MQGATLGPDGALWTVEHGPRGGDELNRPERRANYGWPVITYGVEYSGQPVGEGRTAAEGMEQPLYYWDPVIAPSGMVFYDGEMFPDWQGSLLIGGLASQALVRLELDGTRVTGEARYREGHGPGPRCRRRRGRRGDDPHRRPARRPDPSHPGRVNHLPVPSAALHSPASRRHEA
jgi:glucose/arabinose dehydrogenase